MGLRARKNIGGRYTSLALLVSLSCAACATDEDPRTSQSRGNVYGSGFDASTAGAGAQLGGLGGGFDAALPWSPSEAGAALPPQDAGTPDTAYVKLCDRDIFAHMIDRFVLALKAHDPTSLPFAPGMKFTENGKQLSLGQGIWKTAGETKFKHSAFDLQTCTSVTEAVIMENGVEIPLGVRMKFEPPAPGNEPSQAQPISELEIIAVRPGAYPMPANPQALAASAGEMWEQLITFSQRPARAQLEQILNDYFVRYPAGACSFAPHCQRFENGNVMGACTLGLSCSMAGGANARPRVSVIDVEAGLAVGFVTTDAYTGFLMFRVRAGQVEGFHSILASAGS